MHISVVNLRLVQVGSRTQRPRPKWLGTYTLSSTPRGVAVPPASTITLETISPRSSRQAYMRRNAVEEVDGREHGFRMKGGAGIAGLHRPSTRHDVQHHMRPTILRRTSIDSVHSKNNVQTQECALTLTANRLGTSILGETRSKPVWPFLVSRSHHCADSFQPPRGLSPLPSRKEQSAHPD